MALRTQEIDFLTSIRTHVDDANDVTELDTFMKYIPVESVQQFVRDEMEKVTQRTCKSAYYNALPIDAVLPAAIVQHLLSFEPSTPAIKLVSRAWNKHCERNESIRLQKIYASIQNSNKNEYAAFDAQTNRSIVVHPKRTTLHAVERKLGFIGPIRLADVAKHAQCGDRILVHSGDYFFEDYLRPHSYVEKEHIQIIGVGSAVQFHEISVDHFQAKNVYFENISFTETINVIAAKMVFKKCRFSNASSSSALLCIFRYGDVVIDECRFLHLTGNFCIYTANTARKLRVINSHFVHRKTEFCVDRPRGAIIFIDNPAGGANTQRTVQLQVECMGNIFENFSKALMSSMRNESDGPCTRFSQQCNFKDNVLIS